MLLLLLPNTNGFDCLPALIPSRPLTHTLILLPTSKHVHTCIYSLPPELELHRYGLNEDETYNFQGILNNDVASGTIRQAQDFLNRTYCGNVSIEFAYIESEHEREWLVENYEKFVSNADVSIDIKKDILELLLKSQTWDNFLATKFPSVKRYGGEGAESMMSFFRQLMLLAAQNEVNNIVLAMPHRGKLNLLTTVFKTPPAKIFHKYKGFPEFASNIKAMGDIANHFRK